MRYLSLVCLLLFPSIGWPHDLTDEELKAKAVGRARALIAIAEIEAMKVAPKAKGEPPPVPQPPKILPPKVAPKQLPKASTAPRPGQHAHRCGACGLEWWHGGPGDSTSHHCPRCGKGPWTEIQRYAPVQRIIQSAVPLSADDCAS